VAENEVLLNVRNKKTNLNRLVLTFFTRKNLGADSENRTHIISLEGLHTK